MVPTISEAINAYIVSVSLARSENTARTYQNAMESFRATLADHGYPTSSTKITEITEDAIGWFASDMKAYSPATERLYLSAATGFYEYLVAEQLSELNLPRIRLLIRQRARRPGQRLPQFYKEEIEKVLHHAIKLVDARVGDDRQIMRNMRDRAFLITLADTGLRVHEACKLRRGDVDWREAKAILIGKGNREDIIRFSSRSMETIRDYLGVRGSLDGAAGRPLTSLPLFARHDKGAGDRVKPITTRTGQNIVNQRVCEALGVEAVGIVTPHSFRHYFVTTVLRASGNLKLAQELARHRNIQVTQRYAHLADDELDKGYMEIFE